MPRKCKSTSQKPPGRTRASRRSSPDVSPLTTVFDEEDLVTEILKFVAQGDLDTCALVSHVFSAARNRPVFDQTRTGTIVFRTPFNQIPAETWQRWNQQVFTGNRTRLVAVFTELDSRARTYYGFDERATLVALTNVHHVVLQRDPSIQVPEYIGDRDSGGTAAVSFFKAITPNLDILDIGSLAKTTTDLDFLNSTISALGELQASIFHCVSDGEHDNFCLQQPNVLDIAISPTPEELNAFRTLREFHVAPLTVYPASNAPCISAYCKELHELEQERWFQRHQLIYDDNPRDYVLLQEYPNLERVTLGHVHYDFKWEALPQEALIKFVRHSPSLRWFCSDLTPENVAMLKAERPEVEFCSFSN